MWHLKIFRFRPHGIEVARKQRDEWIDRHQNTHEIREVFVNNAFGLEVRRLRAVQNAK